MKTSFKSHRTTSLLRTSLVDLPGNVLHRHGGMRSVTLGKRPVKTDFIFSARKDDPMSLDRAFGKPLCDLQPEGVSQ